MTAYITQAVVASRELQGIAAQLARHPRPGEALRAELNERHRRVMERRHGLVLAAMQEGSTPDTISWALALHDDTDEAAEVRAVLRQAVRQLAAAGDGDE